MGIMGIKCYKKFQVFQLFKVFSNVWQLYRATNDYFDLLIIYLII